MCSEFLGLEEHLLFYRNFSVGFGTIRKMFIRKISVVVVVGWRNHKKYHKRARESGWSSSKLHHCVAGRWKGVVGGWWIVTLTTTMLGFWWSGWRNFSLSDVLEGFFGVWVGLDWITGRDCEDSSKKRNASCYSINRNKFRII